MLRLDGNGDIAASSEEVYAALMLNFHVVDFPSAVPEGDKLGRYLVDTGYLMPFVLLIGESDKMFERLSSVRVSKIFHAASSFKSKIGG